MYLLVFCLAAAVAGNTVLDVLTEQKRTVFLKYLNNVTNLNETLSGNGDFTIFAPSNDAFDYLDLDYLQQDPDQLEAFVKQHIVNHTVSVEDLRTNEKLLQTEAGTQIRLNAYAATEEVAGNGVPIDIKPHTASNGVVYTTPDAIYIPEGTIMDIISSYPELTKLVDAVKAAGLDTFLADQSPITMFAPTNDAIGAMDSVVLGKILADKNLLKTILLYHVIPGSLYTSGYHDTLLHTFEEVDKIKLHLVYKIFEVDYYADKGRMNISDSTATNGVLHTIDSFLIPESVKQKVEDLKPASGN